MTAHGKAKGMAGLFSAVARSGEATCGNGLAKQGGAMAIHSRVAPSKGTAGHSDGMAQYGVVKLWHSKVRLVDALEKRSVAKPWC